MANRSEGENLISAEIVSIQSRADTIEKDVYLYISPLAIG